MLISPAQFPSRVAVPFLLPPRLETHSPLCQSGFSMVILCNKRLPNRSEFFFCLRWVFVAVHGLSLVAASGGYSSLWCAGFSSWWLLVAEHGL